LGVANTPQAKEKLRNNVDVSKLVISNRNYNQKYANKIREIN
jgi:hypothetical protein